MHPYQPSSGGLAWFLTASTFSPARPQSRWSTTFPKRPLLHREGSVSTGNQPDHPPPVTPSISWLQRPSVQPPAPMYFPPDGLYPSESLFAPLVIISIQKIFPTPFYPPSRLAVHVYGIVRTRISPRHMIFRLQLINNMLMLSAYIIIRNTE